MQTNTTQAPRLVTFDTEAELADDDEDFYPDDALPAHHLDDNGGRQRGECPHSGQARTSNGGCPRGCDGARYHYSNDGHRGCAEKVPG